MPTATRDARIRHYHSQGCNDVQIAGKLCVSARTVANFRRAQNLPVNAPNVVLGREGEQLVTQLAQSMGFTADRPAEWLSPFDVRINGHRVEVKTGRDTEDPGVFKFSTSATRKGRFTNPTQRKNYAKDADFMAFVCKSVHGQPTRVFIMTPVEMAPNMRIDVGKGTYAAAENAWERLR
ncbi:MULTISPECIES: hypothetical protein [Deinococcus]|uniref:PD(D/E)XK endonuclease domain-containing protein n=1 Tax=Deinococcus rufus TaxID=2136097 RepID=A0ABV7ZCX9_9DEIO|nr:hypothetical protein [Deinococcus sp. AB2017081]WQE94980.1 hypothetical protein U2P90_16550 [Deinococcus sp. AB2017081]